MTGKIKRMFLLNLPYVLIALGATKIGEAWRFSVGSRYFSEGTSPDGGFYTGLSFPRGQACSHRT